MLLTEPLPPATHTQAIKGANFETNRLMAAPGADLCGNVFCPPGFDAVGLAQRDTAHGAG